MRKIICAPLHLIPKQLKENTKYFSIYSKSQRKDVGYFGSSLIKNLIKSGLSPSKEIWDFNTISLSVVAADKSVKRGNSPDGWTRQIDLTIYLCNPSTWEPVKEKLEKTLKFLTGDFWTLTFKDGGVSFPTPKTKKSNHCESNKFNEDCVCLLSGGVDSLVGAIDLVAEGHKPIFVSQIVRGDAKIQNLYAKSICPENHHFQWNHNIRLPKGNESEKSTRGRSLVFFAFVALAASAIKTQCDSPVDIYVPENGFISLNIPLTLCRMGSFSTKTTHPVYLQYIQNIWNKVGIRLNLIMPYQFKTKGEILVECKNQQLLEKLVFQSMSCGKSIRSYKKNLSKDEPKPKHCGRCIPCLVRQAAFQYWGKTDQTSKGYLNKLERVKSKSPDDIGAVANACLIAEQLGFRYLISGNLSFFTNHQNRSDYEGVFVRGLNEIKEFLLKEGVI